MFRVKKSRLKWLDGRGDEFIGTEMRDFDFVMMVMNGLRKSFDFINLWEWDNLLSNMNMIHTESSIGLIIREELLIHDRGWGNIKVFAISKLRSVKLRIKIILDDLKDRLLIGCYD